MKEDATDICRKKDRQIDRHLYTQIDRNSSIFLNLGIDLVFMSDWIWERTIKDDSGS